MSNITKSNNSLQVIVAAMHQKDYSIIERMNLRSDALFVIKEQWIVEKLLNEMVVKLFLLTPQRGVGRNRNSGIINSR